MRIHILGSEPNWSPVIGCDCHVCVSVSQKNKRTRASIAVFEGKTVLIDTSPEMRLQVIRAGISRSMLSVTPISCRS